jgi:glycosyltransferase involved in cell wall biosynthesis
MKIVIVGPGIMPIPPYGWGAVESLIWDYKEFLEKINNIQVKIVNTCNNNEIIEQVNQLNPDIVHIQYDNHCHLASRIHCKNIVATSHYGYLDQLDQRTGDGYWGIFRTFINHNNVKIHSLSPSIQDMYIKHGADSNRVGMVPNGARPDLFRYAEECLKPNRSIYLAKIDYRKKQYMYQSISCIDFVGNYADVNFNRNHPNYLGEWNKPTLYENLTNYANLVLLSDGEAHPLVCCEALMAGLGLVISTYASANLDLSLPWIDVIPNEKLEDIQYINHIIKYNQEKSVKYRKQIREYALKTFSWNVIIEHYLDMLKEWFPDVFI